MIAFFDVADKAQDQVVDSPENAEDEEHGQEANHAVHDVGEFHVAGICELLTDFNGEGNDDDNGEHIDPGDDHFVVMLGQIFEQGIDHKDHCHAKQTDDKKVHFLVCEIYFVCVIQMHEIVVDLRDDANTPVKKSFHNNSFLLRGESYVLESLPRTGCAVKLRNCYDPWGKSMVAVDFPMEKTYNNKKRMGE